MYSISTRLNQVFFYGIMCLVALCVFNIATTFYLKNKPEVKTWEIEEISHMYKNPFTKIQHATGKFNLNMDTTQIFNWNTNLVFLWITAHYHTGKNNQYTTTSTIYDIIILRNETLKYNVDIKNENFYYPIIDRYDGLKGKNITFVLNWEQAPVVGPIIKHNLDLGSYKLPDSNPKLPGKRTMAREYDYEVYHLKDS